MSLRRLQGSFEEKPKGGLKGASEGLKGRLKGSLRGASRDEFYFSSFLTPCSVFVWLSPSCGVVRTFLFISLRRGVLFKKTRGVGGGFKGALKGGFKGGLKVGGLV